MELNASSDKHRPEPAMFHIGDVLSITTGRAVSSTSQKPQLPDKKEMPDRDGPFSGVVDILEYVSGESLGRGSRNRDNLQKVYDAAKNVRPALANAFWYLTDIEVPQNIGKPGEADAWVATLAKKYGEYLPVFTLEQYNDPSLNTSSMPPASTQGFADKHQKRDPHKPDGSSRGQLH